MLDNPSDTLRHDIMNNYPELELLTGEELEEAINEIAGAQSMKLEYLDRG